MIVLISDGHGQDRWEDLLNAADRLRATNSIVYAITANRDYYFRLIFNTLMLEEIS